MGNRKFLLKMLGEAEFHRDQARAAADHARIRAKYLPWGDGRKLAALAERREDLLNAWAMRKRIREYRKELERTNA